MKQHITMADLNQLSESQKENLLVWLGVDRFGYDGFTWKDARLSIGEMIEYLGLPLEISSEWCEEHEHTIWYINDERYLEDELCDALWSAVKEQLK